MSKIIDLVSSAMPADRGSRIKLSIAAAVIAICGLWLGYQVIGGMMSGPRRAPQLEGHKIAAQISEKLLEVPQLIDTGLMMESENPLKFKVVGLVHAQADLELLKSKMKELRPEGDYEIDVGVQPK